MQYKSNFFRRFIWEVLLASVRPFHSLLAVYTDGHIESYSAVEAVPKQVSIIADGRTPYPDDVGPGLFFLPPNALI